MGVERARPGCGAQQCQRHRRDLRLRRGGRARRRIPRCGAPAGHRPAAGHAARHHHAGRPATSGGSPTPTATSSASGRCSRGMAPANRGRPATALKPGWPAGLAIARDGTAYVGRSDDDGSEIWRVPATGEGYSSTPTSRTRASGDVSDDGLLISISHSEHGDNRHPALRDRHAGRNRRRRPLGRAREGPRFGGLRTRSAPAAGRATSAAAVPSCSSGI